MQKKTKAEGKCLFCGKTFTKAGINRHLATHLQEKTEKGKTGKSFFVKVEPDKSLEYLPYFLSLLIDGETKMENFDSFLRNIWLECCGHQSVFRDPLMAEEGGGMCEAIAMGAYDFLENGQVAEHERIMEDCMGEIPKSRKTKEVLEKGLVLEYEYDFGSTTDLSITVIDEYPIKADKKVVLLSRNEPLEIMCSICGKAPATQVCSVCIWDAEDALFCDKCAKKHARKCEDFADSAVLPVVNSPRMGVCTYEGGAIDTERDEVFIPKE